MSTFTYTYKTSDGVKHLDQIEAESKDVVFSTLRERGIRPIKVCETTAKRRPRVLFLVAIFIGLAALCGAFCFNALNRKVPAERHPVDVVSDASNKEALADLTVKANIVRGGFKASMRRIDFKHPTSGETNSFVLARSVIADSRSKMRDLFKGLYQIFPESAEVERMCAQRLYGEIMTEIDMVEEQVEFEELKFASENF